jgi:hypothetical protein
VVFDGWYFALNGQPPLAHAIDRIGTGQSRCNGAIPVQAFRERSIRVGFQPGGDVQGLVE